MGPGLPGFLFGLSFLWEKKPRAAGGRTPLPGGTRQEMKRARVSPGFLFGEEKSARSPRRGPAAAGHSFLLLMILDSSSIKLLMSLNWRYTEAKRT